MYPQNMKEAVIASVPNAFTMVVGMVFVNLWIYGALTPENFARVAPMMFVAAFSLDFFIIGPMVKRIVDKYGIQKFTPFIRVAFMAGILTFVAPMIEAGRVVSLSQYLTAAPRNYIVALFLQIFIAMRFGLYVFRTYKFRGAGK